MLDKRINTFYVYMNKQLKYLSAFQLTSERRCQYVNYNSFSRTRLLSVRSSSPCISILRSFSSTFCFPALFLPRNPGSCYTCREYSWLRLWLELSQAKTNLLLQFPEFPRETRESSSEWRVS